MSMHGQILIMWTHSSLVLRPLLLQVDLQCIWRREGLADLITCSVNRRQTWHVVPDEESRGSVPLVASVVNVHNVLPTSNYCCLLHLGLIYSKETVWPALWCRKQLQSCETMWQWVHKIRTQQVESLRACFLMKNVEKRCYELTSEASFGLECHFISLTCILVPWHTQKWKVTVLVQLLSQWWLPSLLP